MSDSEGQAGSTGARHRLLLELGRGGMGTVYLAVAQGPAGFNKLKVIKRLNAELAAEPQFLSMFLDEARLSARLNHPNIVQTNEVGFDSDEYFIEMEYLEGQPYEAIIRRAAKTGGVPMATHLWIISQVLTGLQYAHELTGHDGTRLNIVHRDISPHNIFVTYDGAVKVLDFGIAKAIDSSSETRTGMVKGKATYMAPEQAVRGNVDRRADIFAVGVMLWQAVTGKRLWEGLGDGEIFVKLQTARIARVRDVKPDAPERLDLICATAMAADAEHRYATAEAMQEAVDAYLEGTGERVNAKTVGRFVSELFADRRAAVKKEIEKHLAAGGAPLGPIPQLRQADGYGKTAPSALENAPMRLQPAGVSRAAPATSEGTRTTTAVEAAPQRRPRGRPTTPVLAAGVAVLLAGAGAMAWRTVSTKAPAAAEGIDAAAAHRCKTAADCSASGPRGLCSEAQTCVAAAECITNKECIDSHGGEPFLCRKTDGRCVDLKFPGCVPHAEPADYANDNTIYFGAMFPTTGPMAEYGLPEMRGVEIARLDFAHMAAGIPVRGNEAQKAPLAYVGCDDTTDAAAKARYLAEELHVPGVIGFAANNASIDIVRSELIPHGVFTAIAIGASSILTSIPEPEGTPRLVWRTTTSTIATAPAVAAVVRDIDEPAVRAARKAHRDDAIRVALLRRGTNAGQAYAASMYSILKFNGKSPVENDANFAEITYGDSTGTESKVDYSRTIKDVLEFRPDVMILFGAGEIGGDLLPGIEAGWPASTPRPLYVSTGGLIDPDLVSFVKEDKRRARRVLGVNVPSATLANAQLVTRYNELFSDRITTADAPSSAYDSFYLLAYAAAAADQTEPVTGVALARNVDRLLPPGPRIDVGPIHILDALGALRNNGKIDLNGAMSPLDFSPATGETPVDLVVTCARIDRDGKVVGEMDSGLAYERATDTLVGTDKCAANSPP